MTGIQKQTARVVGSEQEKRKIYFLRIYSIITRILSHN